MAKYSAVKATVNAYIKQNGRKEITGRILNAVLNATIDSLGKYFQFAGGALPTDDPGTPDQNVCYLAGEPGVYTNFGGITIENEEVALLFWDGEWTKQRILIGIREVNASVDNQVGTPSVDVSYSGGELVLTFHNLKGDQGDTGDPAGFGTIGADINGGVGTPGVSVETSGDNTAKNLMFHFTNLKGETGVTSVVATIDDTSGTPSCQVSLVGQQLTLAFSGLKGLKGDTGVSADYPITIYNGLDSDATDQALSAAQGKVLDGKVSQLEQKVDDTIFYNQQDTQLLDLANALPDTRATGSYGADINSTYASNGWTAFPPFYFKETGVKHTLSTNFTGANAVLLGYKKSGDNYVRESSGGMSNWTTVGDEKQIELNANIVAIRFEVVSSQLSDSLYLHSTGEVDTDISIRENVDIPKLTQEAARLDARIDALEPSTDAPWAGKKICGIGDSIMIGCYESGPNKGDAILDGEEGSTYGMEYNSTGGFLGALRAKYPSVDILNMGVGSTTMARNNNITPNANYLCITDRIDNIPQTGYDYILLMGGVNDFFHKDTYNVPYGTESNVEYLPLVADYNTETGQYAANSFRLYPFSGAGNQDLDITTFCGAMEIALIKLMVRFKDKKIGYIIPHAIRPTNEMNAYLDYAKSLCKKYGIPCLDLRELAMMPRILAIAGNSSGSMFTLDAVHPNTLGYEEKYLPALEAWMRTL